MEKTIEHECIAGQEQHGRRLDAALAALFPFLGLRGRRRLWEGHLVLVDGIARSPAFRLRGGETIRLVPLCSLDEERDALCSDDPPRLLARWERWLFFYKPKGLHTESVAGGLKPSLAGLLERIMPDASAIRLLTRLDQETSGIVLAAGDEDAARHWRRRENAGHMDKWYLAVLEGQLDAERTACSALDLAKTRRTRVLDANGPALRHTRIRPLAHFQAGDAPGLMSACPGDTRLTLALCCIAKGARHQIRAHAAHAGHPLAGDVLYGARSEGSFFLHHYRLQWPEGHVSCLPPWQALLPAPLGERVRVLCDCMDAMAHEQALP
jgi:23S rRNA pseudouridine1911/1915/1917 synthase